MPDARQLVVCCDGTNNNFTGGVSDTNVAKLMGLLPGQQAGQVCYYDPGVGDGGVLPGVSLRDRIARARSRIAGLALGRGVYENVAEGYQFLMDHWEPGDEIYCFGFSRGAFTARSIAGMVSTFGILQPQMTGMLPTLVQAYFADRRSPDFVQRVADIRKRCCRADSAGASIHFVGVWDTVASVGIAPFNLKMTARPEVHNKPAFRHVRQALALDEHRASFKPRAYADENGPLPGTGRSMEQRWFSGSHCDTGGGNLRGAAGTSLLAAAWLLDEARAKGLRLADATGAALTSHDQIRAALGGADEVPFVNSELHRNCYWAVAGLTARDPSSVEIDGADDPPVKPAEHPSVALTASNPFPEGTVWATGRSWKAWWFALAGGALVAWLMGTMHRTPFDPGANRDFFLWQLGWWMQPGGVQGWKAFDFPAWALFFDFFFIAAYAYVLAFPMVYAFARLAGVRRVSTPQRPALPVLGRGLMVAVLADLLENAMSLAIIWTDGIVPKGIAWIFGSVMSIAAIAKVVGLAGVALLLLWALLPRAGTARGGAAEAEDVTPPRPA